MPPKIVSASVRARLEQFASGLPPAEEEFMRGLMTEWLSKRKKRGTVSFDSVAKLYAKNKLLTAIVNLAADWCEVAIIKSYINNKKNAIVEMIIKLFFSPPESGASEDEKNRVCSNGCRCVARFLGDEEGIVDFVLGFVYKDEDESDEIKSKIHEAINKQNASIKMQKEMTKEKKEEHRKKQQEESVPSIIRDFKINNSSSKALQASPPAVSTPVPVAMIVQIKVEFVKWEQGILVGTQLYAIETLDILKVQVGHWNDKYNGGKDLTEYNLDRCVQKMFGNFRDKNIGKVAWTKSDGRKSILQLYHISDGIDDSGKNTASIFASPVDDDSGIVHLVGIGQHGREKKTYNIFGWNKDFCVAENKKGYKINVPESSFFSDKK